MRVLADTRMDNKTIIGYAQMNVHTLNKDYAIDQARLSFGVEVNDGLPTNHVCILDDEK